MARNGSGTMVIPNTFSAGQTIAASGENENFSDIGSELTNSLPRDGQAGMIGQFKSASGTVGAPGISFTAAATNGFYKTASGIGVAIAGVQQVEITASGLVLLTGGLTLTAGSFSGIGAMPVGAGPIPWPVSDAPAGWLLCYGQSLLRASYAALFALIGTKFGSADGTHFNMPDLRGNNIVGNTTMGGGAATTNLTSTYFGADPTVIGVVGGSQNETLTMAQLPASPSPIHATVTPTVNGFQPAVGLPSGTTGAGKEGTGGAVLKAVDFQGFDTATITSNSANLGSGNPHPNVQPGIIFNFIMFAGV